MARAKRVSKVIINAEIRKEGIAGINPVFEVTTGLTLVEYSAKIAASTAKQAEYNLALGVVDGFSNELDALLKELRAMSTRFLGAVGAQFSKDSNEYEKAGGKRTSDIKHKKKKVAKITATTPS